VDNADGGGGGGGGERRGELLLFEGLYCCGALEISLELEFDIDAWLFDSPKAMPWF